MLEDIKKDRLPEIIDIIKNLLKSKYQELYFNYNNTFLGCKFEQNNKYYILFFSIFNETICFSYRDDINARDINRVDVSNFSNDEIIRLVEEKLKIAIKYKPNDIVNSTSKSIENIEIDSPKYQKLCESILNYEKNIDKEFFNNKYSSITLEYIPLSNRLYNSCIRNNISTLADLLLTPLEEFYKMQYVGRQTLKEIAVIKKIFYFNPNINYIVPKNPHNKPIKEELNPIFQSPENLKLKEEFTDEEYESYLDFGIELGTITLEFLNDIPNIYAEIFKMRMNITSNENYTLQYIGDSFHLTRERIRQIINKIKRKARHPNNLKYKYIKIINKIAREDILNYLILGVVNTYNLEFLKFILNVANPDIASSIISKVNQLIRKSLSTNYKAKLYSLINFPEYLNPDAENIFNSLTIQRFTNATNYSGKLRVERFNKEVEYESNTEKRIINMLSECDFVKNIKTQALTINYTYNNKKYPYYPDIQILTTDNKLVIIEIKPSYYMADYFVLVKYNALKSFCEKYGFGYAMIDDRFNSLESIKNINVAQETEDIFLRILKNKHKLNYYEYKTIKENYNITTLEILKIILNNQDKIKYSTMPFYILYTL